MCAKVNRVQPGLALSAVCLQARRVSPVARRLAHRVAMCGRAHIAAWTRLSNVSLVWRVPAPARKCHGRVHSAVSHPPGPAEQEQSLAARVRANRGQVLCAARRLLNSALPVCRAPARARRCLGVDLSAASQNLGPARLAPLMAARVPINFGRARTAVWRSRCIVPLAWAPHAMAMALSSLALDAVSLRRPRV